ncbi:MAG: sensor histidine kinase, partial [Ruminiclostridium sp.]|nr:sensor histidine kinase [Ruminiclostridium sp.]
MKPLKILTRKPLKADLRRILHGISILLVIIFLLVENLVSYNVTKSIILGKIEKIDESNLRQVKNRLNYSVGEIEKVIEKTRENSQLQNFMHQYNVNKNNTYEKLRIKTDIENELLGIIEVYKNIRSIVVIVDEEAFTARIGYSSQSYSDLINSDIYKTIKASGHDIEAVLTDIYNSNSLDKNSSIGFATGFYNGNVKTGVLLIEMKYDWMNSLFKSNDKIIIVNNKQKSMVWSGSSMANDIYSSINNDLNSDSGSLKKQVDNDIFKIFYIKTWYKDWFVITFDNVSNTSREINKAVVFIVISFTISLLLSLIIAFSLSKRIVKPLNDLTKAIGSYRGQKKANYISKVKMRLSLRDNIMLYFIIILTVPMVINSLTLYFTLSRVIENKYKQSILLTFNQTLSNIDYFIENSNRISMNIMFDKNIRNYLIKDYSDENYKLPTSGFNDLKKAINENISLGEDVFEICLYNKTGKLIFSTSFFNQDDISEELRKKIDGTYTNVLWSFNNKDIYNRNTIKLFRKIKKSEDEAGISSDLSTAGYISMTYNEVGFEKLYKDISIGDGKVFVVDDSGTIISHNIKSLIGQNISINIEKNITPAESTFEYRIGSPDIFVYAKCSSVPLILTGEIPYDEVSKDNRRILISNLYTFFICICFIAVLSFLISNSIANSINRLNNILIKFGNGDNTVDFMGKAYINEIEEMGEAFNSMSIRIQELIDEVYVSQIKEMQLESEKKNAENEKKSAELIALQAQINPHFLYNTLESIIWLIDEGSKDKASEMIASLGDLFRLGIRNADQCVRIEEEIKHAMTYVAIQKIKFGDKLAVQWFICDGLLSYMTPKLILQPLIENSIHHGIQKKPEGGFISIHIYEECGNVLVKVADNGIGVEPERLKEIQKVLGGELKGTSIGIFNVQKRIQLYFGMEYGVVMESTAGEGTTVI